jgi:hypothetical protein
MSAGWSDPKTISYVACSGGSFTDGTDGTVCADNRRFIIIDVAAPLLASAFQVAAAARADAKAVNEYLRHPRHRHNQAPRSPKPRFRKGRL